MKKELRGQVLGVLIAVEVDSLVSVRRPEVKVTLEGFEGEKHSGFTRLSDARTPHYPCGTEIRNERQISIVSIEELEQIASGMSLSEIRPEWIGANLLLCGIPNLTFLPPTTRLRFSQGAVLAVQNENLPCVHPGKVIQSQYPDVPDLSSQFPKAALHKRGVVACVEKAGRIGEGDGVVAEIPQQVIYGV